jgi:cell division protein FtsN
MQAGAFRDVNVAERKREQLGKLGIEATVQRVAVDADVWHRVRIGPIRDLAKLNRLRAQLRQLELDALVIRVDD